MSDDSNREGSTPLGPVATIRCRLLLSKGLYTNHGLPPGEEISGDGHFWCGQTQTKLGPDRQVCSLDQCTDSTRNCFKS
ncbi:MAG: hypothetical protein R3C11_23980 [Planctomycetaceae bacterium]